jgi:hypothetical protein
MKQFIVLQVILSAIVCMEVEWTRFSGTVKATNQRTQTVTIQNRDGDLITIPVDYQVTIMHKDELRQLKDLQLDEKVTLMRTPKERPLSEEPPVPEWEPKKK